MIKINLVPAKEKKKQKEFIVVFFAVVFFVIAILGMFYIYVQRLSTANDLNHQIDEVNKESQGYQDKINEIKDLQAKRDSLDAIKKTIKGISEVQRKVLVAIDQMAVNMPDGIWLSKITEGTGNDSNKFMVLGYAVSVDKIENYYSNLQRPGSLLKEVTFDEKNVAVNPTSNNAKLQLHSFEIDFRVADQGT